MDDFVLSNLYESRNEWAAILVTTLTPLISEGYKSILSESVKLCRDNDEHEKYLMTFQNFISRIPKWNSTIINDECVRIIDKSGCSYLEDLITCVHIIQLKIMSSMRVGTKQKKIEISTPNLNDFIHNVYINVARKVYKNVYLFEMNISPLQIQKNCREIEIIIQECILNTLRENIPIESILKAYLEETDEETIKEDIREEVIYKTTEPQPSVTSDTTDKTGGSADGATGFVTDEPIKQHTLPTLNLPSDTPLPSPSQPDPQITFNSVVDVAPTPIPESIVIGGSVAGAGAGAGAVALSLDNDIHFETMSDTDSQSEYGDGGMNDESFTISDQNVKLGELDILDINDINDRDITLIPDLMPDDIKMAC